MKKLHQCLRIFVMAVLAGMAIGIGCCLFLSVEDKVVGALLFTVGLYTICLHGLNLFTGKVGYLVNQPLSYCLDLLIIWAGNFTGTFLDAAIMGTTRISGISERAAEICQIKMGDSLPSLFLLAVFCGFLMFVAVDGYGKSKNPIILFLGVSAFILCGFEHCIADMFYFSIAQMWSGKAFLCVLVITAGNALGGNLISLAGKLPKEQE